MRVSKCCGPLPVRAPRPFLHILERVFRESGNKSWEISECGYGRKLRPAYTSTIEFLSFILLFFLFSFFFFFTPTDMLDITLPSIRLNSNLQWFFSPPLQPRYCHIAEAMIEFYPLSNTAQLTFTTDIRVCLRCAIF